MYYYNNFGCLVGIILFFVIFLSFTKLLFTTPLGLVLIVYLIYRWYVGNRRVTTFTASQNGTVYEETDNFNSNNDSQKQNDEMFNKDEVIDIDYEEIDD